MHKRRRRGLICRPQASTYDDAATVATTLGGTADRPQSQPLPPVMSAVAVAPPAALLQDLLSLVMGDLVLGVSLSSGRKTIEIIVERDTSLTLKVPPTMTVERAQQFVEVKSEWIYRKLLDKDA
ncbi:MAG: DUF45 domain-containing protein [Acidimicrobiaceae bacterium]|nr:DUF45 domain-containing protein [Acidimicrobiaceae bacterium]